MRYFRSLILLFLLVFPAESVIAQKEDPIRIETNLVSVGVVVKDNKGNFVTGLKKGEFEVFDNKIKQEISFFSAENAPVSYGIVYDLHPTTSERTGIVLESLRKFTDGLRDEDDFFIVVFNERGSLNLNFIPNARQVARHLSFGERNEPNSLYDAVFLAGEKIRQRKNQKKTLIIISDGKDHYSHHGFSSLSKQLKSFNVQIFAVILNQKEKWAYSDLTMGDDPQIIEPDNGGLEQAALDELSRKSGGLAESVLLRNGQSLSRIYQRITSRMRQQYSIGFYPQEIDLKKHKLKIKVLPKAKGKKLKLAYRKEYQSNAKKP